MNKERGGRGVDISNDKKEQNRTVIVAWRGVGGFFFFLSLSSAIQTNQQADKVE